MTAVPGYHLWPSVDVVRLRPDLPDYLVCELHDEHRCPHLIATRTTPTVNGAAVLVVAPDVAALRAKLSVQPATRPLPHLGGELS